MISNLVRPSLNFSGNETNAVRNSYKAKLEQNSRIAQMQGKIESNNLQNQNTISMQGSAQGQKLDVIA